jgi:hypothetical protein
MSFNNAVSTTEVVIQWDERIIVYGELEWK